MEPLGRAKVSAIADGRSFTVEDGREIRLPGIEVPPPPRAGESGVRHETGSAARSALSAMLGGQWVELRRRVAAVDRYGRILAHAYFLRDSTQQSAAHELLAAGWARVSDQVGDRACAAELLARERSARERKLGLWGEPYYAVADAENFADLLAGRFTVVEGKVLSVRESAGTIYVNFGRRWSQALTVTILKRNERNFVAAGIDPKRLENVRLRVRGWVEDRNGPRIEATRPEQIEFTER